MERVEQIRCCECGTLLAVVRYFGSGKADWVWTIQSGRPGQPAPDDGTENLKCPQCEEEES